VALAAAFYVGLSALIIGSVLDFPALVPHWVGSRVEHNTEGYVAALLLGAWIQFARPRLRRSTRQWAATLAVATLWLALGVLLIALPVPREVKMLHEAFFALALLTPYVQLGRRLPTRSAVLFSVGLLAAIAVGHRGRLVTDLAETWGMLLLASIGFDVVDRGILDPGARTSQAARYLWYALLIGTPIGTSVLEYDIGDSGALEVITRYTSRVTEAFVFMLLIALYFVVGLGRTGTPHDAEGRSAAPLLVESPGPPASPGRAADLAADPSNAVDRRPL